jgi:hypothetical protein
MQVKYFPKLNLDYSKIAGQDIAFDVLTPDIPRDKYFLEIAIHGIGERSGGTIDNLKNLVLGFDYNGDGVRESAFVTDDMKKAVDQFGIIMIVPTYESNTFFEPAKINQLYDWAQKNYLCHPKMILTGFSLGGGAVVKYITSSIANANRVAYAIPCAATNDVAYPAIPGQAGLAVHAFHNDNDDRVHVSSTKSIISEINKSNPALKALMTIFRKDGHGGNIEAWGLAPPKAPNGEGFTDAAENIYQVATDIILNGPRQMKSGTAQPTPAPQPAPAPLPALQPVVSYKVEGNDIHLTGDKSTGYKTGADGRWEFVSAPAGVTKAQVFPGGSTYINADGKLPKPGTYKFEFYLKGVSKPVEVTVEHGTAAKTLTGFDSSTDTITYSDGTTEKGIAVLANGKWTIKNSSGKVIE